VQNPGHSRGAFLAFSACVVFLLAFALISGTAWVGKSATFDEPLHFMGAWLETHYADFRCDPEDPPLWQYYAVIGTDKSRLHFPTSGLIWDRMLIDRRMEGLFFRQVFFYLSGNDVMSVLANARLRMLFLGVVLGAGIAWWAWRLGGPVAGAVAAAGFCLDPNFLAHSPLLKNDVAISLAFLCFMAAIWRVGRRVTPLNCAALALTMGAALAVKFSGILTIPILILALTARALLPEPWPCLNWIAQTRARRLAAAAGIAFASCSIAYFLLWACYLFRYGPSTDPHQTFDFSEMWWIAAKHEAFAAYHAFNLDTTVLQQWYIHWRPGVVYRVVLWIGNHRLLPQAWVEGFLFTWGTAPGREAFLLGTSAMSGRWYYFPVAIAVKTPLATLAALAISVVYWAVRRVPFPRCWDCLALLLLPIVYVATAMTSDLNLGIRHVLPVYPFLFIILGLTAADGLRQFRRPATIVISLFLLGLALETYTSYPDFIPFFNIAAGGWENGPRLLGDSNVDWGQDLPAIAQWQRQHLQYQLFLNYFGSADPRYYGIHYVNLPGSNAPDDEIAVDSRPPVYAISSNASHAPWLTPEAKDFYAKLQSRQPIAVLGHCIYLYNQP
jgi:hypothetical protein